MKKEIILSIAIGFGVGLLITFGIYSARQAIKQANQIMSPKAEEELVANSAPSPIAREISLSSPLDQSITDKAKIALSGQTSPEIPVVILYALGEKIVVSDSKGSFETEIELEGGENEIEIQAIFEDGQKTNKKITVVYTTAEI
jgi:hypothetical protein